MKDYSDSHLKFHPNEVSSVAVDAVDSYEAVTVGCYHITVLLELQRSHVRARGLENNERV